MIIKSNIEMPFYLQIYTHYKEAILQGQLNAHMKLPSIRELSRRLDLSKTTIEKAYHQLIIEGFIYSIDKSGYYVNALETLKLSSKRSLRPSLREEAPLNVRQAKDTIDIKLYRKCVNEVLTDHQDALLTPPSEQGAHRLREALALKLKEIRAVSAHADDIIIASGIQNHITTLKTLLKSYRVAYITPLFDRAHAAFKTLGFDMIPCKNIDEMLESKPDLLYLSPANTYPEGDIISIEDRLKVIKYAKENHVHILEDDYNYIFRYNAYQIPSIQGYAKGQYVIYIGSFTRSLLVSTRLSYMVLPPDLMHNYRTRIKLAQTVSTLDQYALALFIEKGFYRSHLKKLSSFAKKQNEHLIKTLDSISLPDGVRVFGRNSNLHIIIHADTLSTTNALTKKISAMNFQYKRLEDDSILLPYAGLSPDKIEKMLHELFV